MSKPFFIWTMRRTGGTSLTTLLDEINEHNATEQEPFNPKRKLGRFIKSFRNGKELSGIISELEQIFSSTPPIKHCYELFDLKFNTLIIKAMEKRDYKHLFLSREDEIARISSLYLAKLTSVWGPMQKERKYHDIISGKITLAPFNIEEMINHYKNCKNISNKIKRTLIENHQEFKTISFEDFYCGNKADRLKKLDELFDYLEFGNNTSNTYKENIAEKIFNNSQNSQIILKHVPNYKKMLETLAELKK